MDIDITNIPTYDNDTRHWKRLDYDKRHWKKIYGLEELNKLGRIAHWDTGRRDTS